ncbi:MAG: hypothetical protein HKM22_03690 [Gammaproteobacteria bacterium]|nr:hypothetical protein [Gammaproteobacteria bacterium]
MTSSGLITIGFSSHRPETLPFVAEQMQSHEAILLEEPETPGFEQMLKGKLSIENYLLDTDFEYPEFSLRSCELFQNLYQNGKQLFQVDPFITQLNAIHDFFASGGKPHEIEADTPRGIVYNAERDYSAALLAYYERCLTAPFDEVVRLVKRFAREDARRGRLRDQMRAEAINALIPAYKSVYVEAGLLHLSLLNRLRERLPAEYRIRPAYLMAPVVRQLTTRRQAWGPGDMLTLLYTYRPGYARPRADRLAAQSLIYTKIIIKEEMAGPANTFPHTRNEVESSALVQKLTYSDCEKLYALTKNRTTKEAMEILRVYVDS